MSFLIDPPLLVASGAAVEATSPNAKSARVRRAVVAATFVTVGGALWANAPYLGAFWKPFGSRSGREFMVSSGIAPIAERKLRTRRAHLAAGALLAMYPAWAWLGAAAQRAVRRRGA